MGFEMLQDDGKVYLDPYGNPTTAIPETLAPPVPSLSPTAATPSGFFTTNEPTNYAGTPTIASPSPSIDTESKGVIDYVTGIPGDLVRGAYEGVTHRLPELVGQAMEWGGLEKAGKGVAEWAREGAPDSEQESMFYQGTEMIGPSIGVPLVMNVAGKALMALPHPVAKLAGVALQAGSGVNAAIFGMAQAQQTRDTAKEAGVPEGYAPYINGLIEATGEYFGTKYLGKLIGTVDGISYQSFKQFFKEGFLKVLPVEVLTEMGQGYGEAWVEKNQGIRPNADPLAEALSVIGPTTVMTAVLAAFGAAHGKHKLGKQAQVAGEPAPGEAEVDEGVIPAAYVAGELPKFDKLAAKSKGLVAGEIGEVGETANELTPDEEITKNQFVALATALGEDPLIGSLNPENDNKTQVFNFTKPTADTTMRSTRVGTGVENVATGVIPTTLTPAAKPLATKQETEAQVNAIATKLFNRETPTSEESAFIAANQEPVVKAVRKLTEDKAKVEAEAKIAPHNQALLGNELFQATGHGVLNEAYANPTPEFIASLEVDLESAKTAGAKNISGLKAYIDKVKKNAKATSKAKGTVAGATTLTGEAIATETGAIAEEKEGPVDLTTPEGIDAAWRALAVKNATKPAAGMTAEELAEEEEAAKGPIKAKIPSPIPVDEERKFIESHKQQDMETKEGTVITAPKVGTGLAVRSPQMTDAEWKLSQDENKRMRAHKDLQDFYNKTGGEKEVAIGGKPTNVLSVEKLKLHIKRNKLSTIESIQKYIVEQAQAGMDVSNIVREAEREYLPEGMGAKEVTEFPPLEIKGKKTKKAIAKALEISNKAGIAREVAGLVGNKSKFLSNLVYREPRAPLKLPAKDTSLPATRKRRLPEMILTKAEQLLGKTRVFPGQERISSKNPLRHGPMLASLQFVVHKGTTIQEVIGLDTVEKRLVDAIAKVRRGGKDATIELEGTERTAKDLEKMLQGIRDKVFEPVTLWEWQEEISAKIADKISAIIKLQQEAKETDTLAEYKGKLMSIDELENEKEALQKHHTLTTIDVQPTRKEMDFLAERYKAGKMTLEEYSKAMYEAEFRVAYHWLVENQFKRAYTKDSDGNLRFSVRPVGRLKGDKASKDRLLSQAHLIRAGIPRNASFKPLNTWELIERKYKETYNVYQQGIDEKGNPRELPEYKKDSSAVQWADAVWQWMVNKRTSDPKNYQAITQAVGNVLAKFGEVTGLSEKTARREAAGQTLDEIANNDVDKLYSSTKIAANYLKARKAEGKAIPQEMIDKIANELKKIGQDLKPSKMIKSMLKDIYATQGRGFADLEWKGGKEDKFQARSDVGIHFELLENMRKNDEWRWIQDVRAGKAEAKAISASALAARSDALALAKTYQEQVVKGVAKKVDIIKAHMKTIVAKINEGVPKHLKGIKAGIEVGIGNLPSDYAKYIDGVYNQTTTQMDLDVIQSLPKTVPEAIARIEGDFTQILQDLRNKKLREETEIRTGKDVGVSKVEIIGGLKDEDDTGPGLDDLDTHSAKFMESGAFSQLSPKEQREYKTHSDNVDKIIDRIHALQNEINNIVTSPGVKTKQQATIDALTKEADQAYAKMMFLEEKETEVESTSKQFLEKMAKRKKKMTGWVASEQIRHEREQAMRREAEQAAMSAKIQGQKIYTESAIREQGRAKGVSQESIEMAVLINKQNILLLQKETPTQKSELKAVREKIEELNAAQDVDIQESAVTFAEIMGKIVRNGHKNSTFSEWKLSMSNLLKNTWSRVKQYARDIWNRIVGREKVKAGIPLSTEEQESARMGIVKEYSARLSDKELATGKSMFDAIMKYAPIIQTRMIADANAGLPRQEQWLINALGRWGTSIISKRTGKVIETPRYPDILRTDPRANERIWQDNARMIHKMFEGITKERYQELLKYMGTQVITKKFSSKAATALRGSEGQPYLLSDKILRADVSKMQRAEKDNEPPRPYGNSGWTLERTYQRKSEDIKGTVYFRRADANENYLKVLSSALGLGENGINNRLSSKPYADTRAIKTKDAKYPSIVTIASEEFGQIQIRIGPKGQQLQIHPSNMARLAPALKRADMENLTPEQQGKIVDEYIENMDKVTITKEYLESRLPNTTIEDRGNGKFTIRTPDFSLDLENGEVIAYMKNGEMRYQLGSWKIGKVGIGLAKVAKMHQGLVDRTLHHEILHMVADIYMTRGEQDFLLNQYKNEGEDLNNEKVRKEVWDRVGDAYGLWAGEKAPANTFFEKLKGFAEEMLFHMKRLFFPVSNTIKQEKLFRLIRSGAIYNRGMLLNYALRGKMQESTMYLKGKSIQVNPTRQEVKSQIREYGGVRAILITWNKNKHTLYTFDWQLLHSTVLDMMGSRFMGHLGEKGEMEIKGVKYEGLDTLFFTDRPTETLFGETHYNIDEYFDDMMLDKDYPGRLSGDDFGKKFPEAEQFSEVTGPQLSTIPGAQSPEKVSAQKSWSGWFKDAFMQQVVRAAHDINEAKLTNLHGRLWYAMLLDAMGNKDTNNRLGIGKEPGVIERALSLPFHLGEAINPDGSIKYPAWHAITEAVQNKLKRDSEHRQAYLDQTRIFQELPKENKQRLYPLMMWSTENLHYLTNEELRDKSKVAGIYANQKHQGNPQLSDREVKGYLQMSEFMQKMNIDIGKQSEVSLLRPYTADNALGGSNFEILRSAYMAQVNGEKNRKELERKLLAMKVANLTRAYHNLMRRRNSIHEMRSEHGKGLEGYFPINRPNGSHYVLVRRRTPDMAEGDSYVVGMYTAKNANHAVRIMEKLQYLVKTDPLFVKDSADTGSQFIVNEKTIGKHKTLHDSTYFMIGDMNMQRVVDIAITKIKNQGVIGSELADGLSESMYESIADIFKARGAGQHSISRQFTKWEQHKTMLGGSIEDYDQTLSGYVNGYYGMTSKFNLAMESMKIMRDEKLMPQNLPLMFTQISKYTQSMLRNADRNDRIVGRIKNFAFSMYLLGKFSAVFMQATQNFVTGIPMLAAELRKHGIKSNLLAAEGLTMKAFYDISFNHKNITAEEQAMLTRMKDEGITLAQFAKELEIVSATGVQKSKLKVIKALGWAFSTMETFNRQAAALAYYRAFNGEGKGRDTGKALDSRIEKYINWTHYWYGKGNKPAVTWGDGVASRVADTAYTFRTFQHQYLLGLWYGFQKYGNVGGLLMAGRSFAWLIALAGVPALPFLDDFMDVLERVLGRPLRTEAKMKVNKMLGKNAEEFYGAGAMGYLFGIDAAASIRPAGLPWPIVGKPTELTLGVYAGLINKAAKAWHYGPFGTQEYLRMAESAAPTAVENLLKGYRLADVGATMGNGKLLFGLDGKPIKLDTNAMVKQMAGFKDYEYSMATAGLWTMGNVERSWQNKAEGIREKMATARTAEERREVRKMVTDYNLSIPRELRPIVPNINMTVQNQPDQKHTQYYKMLQRSVY
jgi:hypothetical protein